MKEATKGVAVPAKHRRYALAYLDGFSAAAGKRTAAKRERFACDEGFAAYQSGFIAGTLHQRERARTEARESSVAPHPLFDRGTR